MMRQDLDLAAEARVLAPAEVDRIVAAQSPFRAEHADFEMPAWIWGVVLAGYATFFAGLIGATFGEARAAFAIVVSLFYAGMFFGVAFILANLDGRRVGAFTQRPGGELNVATGPMRLGAVASQMLAIPILLGFFGVAIAVVSAIVL